MSHSEIQDAVPLFALGGLSAREQAELEAHLAVCPVCRALLSEYAFVAQELEQQVPLQPIPAGLQARLMQQVASSAIRQPTKPRAMANPLGKRSFWRQSIPVARWTFALALVLLLALLTAAGVLGYQVYQTNAARANEVVQLFTATERRFVSLSGAGMGNGSPQATVYLSPTNSTALLWVYNLSPLDNDHVYQVWLRRNGERVSCALFRPGYDGRAAVIIRAPDALSEYTDIGITVEPAGGSAAPTTPRIIGGSLN